MPDFLSIMERTLKAVRYGIFQASDQLALALDGLCRAPEEQDASYTYCGAQCPDWDTEVTCLKPRGHMFSHQCYETFWPLDSAASPQVAVVAPSPKQGSDSGPADSDIPPSPAGPPQPFPIGRPPVDRLAKALRHTERADTPSVDMGRIQETLHLARANNELLWFIAEWIDPRLKQSEK
jgi:hypothetical protein